MWVFNTLIAKQNIEHPQYLLLVRVLKTAPRTIIISNRSKLKIDPEDCLYLTLILQRLTQTILYASVQLGIFTRARGLKYLKCIFYCMAYATLFSGGGGVQTLQLDQAEQ